jgi:pimeloyl-ACP methyl ester carboxylesterase
VLLHPAAIDSRAFGPNLEAFAARFRTYTPDRRGHGHTPDVPGPITLEHAIRFYRGLPDGELAVVPGTSHGLLVEKPDLCNRIILDFLTLDPVETFALIRRATV